MPPTTASAGDAVGVGPRAAAGYRRMAPSAGKVFSLQTLGGSSLQNIFGSRLRESENHPGVAQNGSRQRVGSLLQSSEVFRTHFLALPS